MNLENRPMTQEQIDSYKESVQSGEGKSTTQIIREDHQKQYEKKN